MHNINIVYHYYCFRNVMDLNYQAIRPTGILNVVSGNQLRRDVSDSISCGNNIILIDLQNVEFVDSSGLGALVAAMQSVKSVGGKFYICSVNEQVKMLFELTKMERLFKIYVNRNEFDSQVVTS